jgi:putative component of toxin-antitoxin plasmid stabilization module
MVELIKSRSFHDWLTNLRDRRGAAKIQARLDRLAPGNPATQGPSAQGYRN